MKRFIAIVFFAFLALFSILANAADRAYFDNGEVAITLKGEPCDSPVLVRAFAQAVPVPALAAVARYQGKDHVACWAMDADGDVLVIDESGGGGFIPGAAFGSTRKPAAKPGVTL
jgi:hypothetical protein